MIADQKVIAVIPARGGSKSVPLKNLKLLGAKPLVLWPIETALSTPEIDRTILSTDDSSIAAVGAEAGAEVYLRPDSLSGDRSLVVDALRHLRDQLLSEGERVDILVLLEPTSPFRSPSLVSRCLSRMISEQLDSIATFHASSINPHRLWKIDASNPRPFIEGANPWKPRQTLPAAFQLNGAVYAFRAWNLPLTGPSVLFGKIGAEVVPAEDVVDIDDQRDFIIANAILESRRTISCSSF